jgi:ABC-2 type transport system permease protein
LASAWAVPRSRLSRASWFLILAGFADLPYHPVLIVTLIGELLLLSFTRTAFGVMMAARIRQFQAFMALT